MPTKTGVQKMLKYLWLAVWLVLVAAVPSVAFWFAAMDRSNSLAKNELAWHWSNEKANLENCSKRHLNDYDVELLLQGHRDVVIVIRTKGQKQIICSFRGHSGTPLACANNTLFIAEQSPIASGCQIIAIDLKTGKYRWKTQLQGIGPVCHSEYLNKVNLNADGDKIVIYGNEASGRYVEILNMRTGRMIANRTLKADFKSLYD